MCLVQRGQTHSKIKSSSFSPYPKVLIEKPPIQKKNPERQKNQTNHESEHESVKKKIPKGN
jgi:hypothetical protein